jgi:acetate CoA/acetoacetate CoA-transferase beta subunit
MGMGVDVRNRIAKRAAKEIHDGLIVNLGIGIPTLVADHLPQDIHVLFHAENGVLGTGPSPNPGQEDPALCNAGGFPITTVTGASYFDSATAFGMIRRGYIDITILGALEVSEKGDLANWIVPGKRVPGMDCLDESRE